MRIVAIVFGGVVLLSGCHREHGLAGQEPGPNGECPAGYRITELSNGILRCLPGDAGPASASEEGSTGDGVEDRPPESGTQADEPSSGDPGSDSTAPAGDPFAGIGSIGPSQASNAQNDAPEADDDETHRDTFDDEASPPPSDDVQPSPPSKDPGPNPPNDDTQPPKGDPNDPKPPNDNPNP